MPRRVGNFKTEKPRHFLKQWRKYRNLTQEALSSRLEMSVANYNRIETGKQPYTQTILEALADALLCNPQDLIARDPKSAAFGIQVMLQSTTPEKQREIERVVRAMLEAA